MCVDTVVCLNGYHLIIAIPFEEERMNREDGSWPCPIHTNYWTFMFPLLLPHDSHKYMQCIYSKKTNGDPCNVQVWIGQSNFWTKHEHYQTEAQLPTMVSWCKQNANSMNVVATVKFMIVLLPSVPSNTNLTVQLGPGQYRTTVFHFHCESIVKGNESRG